MNTEIEQETEIQLSYGELTMLKLEELLGEIYSANRNSLPVGSYFWDWRKENKARAGVLNKAGLVLNKTEAGWRADMSAVTADTLDKARDDRIQWKRTEVELKERANRYMRQNDHARYLPGGQFGGPV
jgi:hypothetical protein